MKITRFKSLLIRLGALALIASLAAETQAAFSVTASTSGGGTFTGYTIDTDSGLVFTVRANDSGSSTQSIGDISSLKYNGVEFTDASKGTQINSGADWTYPPYNGVNLKVELIDSLGNITIPTVPTGKGQSLTTYGTEYVKVTVLVDDGLGKVLTHYYLAKRGDAKIYMGTHFTAEPTSAAQQRFIVRVPIAALPNGPAATSNSPGFAFPNGTWPNDNRGTTGAIESADVFGFNSGTYAGESRSKHYSNMRVKDWSFIGGTGQNVGLWILRDNNEGGSGGPFYRCLLNQITATNNEITYMVNYGEGQTEAFRMNRLNTFTLVFTDGSTPAPVDTAWFSLMNLTGYVAPQNRGAVSLAGINGRDPKFAYTVGFANADAQYWADVNPIDGTATSTGMIPGTYTMKVYKNELPVNSRTVTVTAGETNQQSAVSVVADTINNTHAAWYIGAGDPSLTPALFRIGEWDGTPLEFINGDKLSRMHPSDVRMSTWVVPTYLVGTSKPATGIPAYQWKDVNGTLTIQFKLKASQISATSNYRLRVGITTAYNGARPKIKFNGVDSPNPAASTQPKTRTLTVGIYRANPTTYNFNIPANSLIAGTNTLIITPISGTAGTGFLSPGYAFDAIDLLKLDQPAL